MRQRGLQIALMLVGVAVAGYAGCSVDSTTGGIITTGGLTSGDFTTTTSTGLTTSSSSGSNTTSSSTTTTTTGSSTTSTGGNAADNLALQCAADSDCGAGLKCLTGDANNPILGGGAANGYCSKDCATDDDCPGNASFCLGATAGKPGICLLTCDIGPKLSSPVEPLDEGKCLGREDLRCGAVNASGQITACLPTCGSDDQCPTAKVCDPRSEVCVTTAHTGLPLGAKCNPMAPTPECAGLCINFSGGETMCSSPCVLGGVIDFNDLEAVKDCGGLSKGLCAYSPTNNGAGDFGICAQACKEQGDCQNPTFWCGDVGLPDNGFCFGGVKACPKGDADCADPETCADTKFGPLCLDPKYPLGTAAPVGTTSSASASSSTGSGAGGSSSSASGAGGSSSSASTGP